MLIILEVKHDDGKESAKAAIYNSIANIIVMLVGVLMIPITTRILPTEDMGTAVSFNTIRNICMYLFTLSMYSSIHKGMLDYKDEKKEFLSSIFIFGSAIIVLLFIIYLPFKPIINNLLGFSDFLMYWLFISIFLLMARTIGMNYLLFHNKYMLTFIITILAGPFAQFFSIYLISTLKTNKYFGRILGLDVFNCIVGSVIIVVLLLKGKFVIRKRYVKYALTISLPLIPHLIAQIMLTQSDILMINHFEGASKTGIYSMAYTIGALLYTALTQLMSAWSPWVYRRLEEGNIEPIYKNSKLLLLIGGILAVGLMAITPEMVNIFLDDSYKECMYIIPSIVVGMFFQFIYLFFYDIEYFHKKTKYIAISSVIAAITNIILNLIFIPIFGYVAAGYTTAVGYLVLSLMHYIYMKKIDKRKIYDINLMLTTSISVVIFAILMFIFINNIILRYSIFILGCFLIFILVWKDIIKFLRVIRS